MAKSRTNLFAALTGITLALLTIAFAAEQEQPKPAEPKYTEIKYSADASSYKWDGQDRILVLLGNVTFLHGDTTMTADRVEYHESTKTADATGSPKIFDPRNTILGEKCSVNFKEKKGSMIGNVKVVIKPKEKPKDASDSRPKSLTSEIKEDTILTCGAIDYYYKEKRAVSPGKLKVVEKNRIVTADSGTYLTKEELVTMVGNVKGVDEKEKHNFSAPRMTVSLRETDQWVQAEKATGSFFVEEEQDTAPAPKK
jgi:lipopolysaccharide assembly outer membrane protein LptD (OstA)